MRDFVWNDQNDPQEISLDVPAGYQMRNIKMDVTPATEKDLIESLRSLATINGGEFPAGLDLNALSTVMKNSMGGKKGSEVPKELQERVMNDSIRIVKGMGFATETNGTDWRYAGQGVKLDAADRAILWYKPKGAEKYRVINADLTAHEVAADALPKVESKPIAAVSPFGAATTKPAPPPVVAPEPLKAK